MDFKKFNAPKIEDLKDSITSQTTGKQKKGKSAPKPDAFKLPEVADRVKLIVDKAYKAKDYSTYKQEHTNNISVAEAILEKQLEDLKPLLPLLKKSEHSIRQEGFFLRLYDNEKKFNQLTIRCTFRPNYTRIYNINASMGGSCIFSKIETVTCRSTVQFDEEGNPL